MPASSTIVIFTFETTHQALWAEDVAREKGVPHEMAPAPPEVDAKCGLSVRTPAGHADGLARPSRRKGSSSGVRSPRGIDPPGCQGPDRSSCTPRSSMR